ncbi:MAG: type II toxin-antitoxin system Phd/YefM family antitoxin [Clostridiales Family XIII bacterium]|nr:type II toxin-antitoxin system Phd/YefM family antitoxin [Clostridiales Family XIII bacterium]
MEQHKIGEFLQGQSSRILTSLAEHDRISYVLKYGKPFVVVMSYERYERLLQAGIDINDY